MRPATQGGNGHVDQLLLPGGDNSVGACEMDAK